MAADPARGAAVLLEREGELELIGAPAARAGAGEGGVVVAEGQAGVGKTVLLRAAAELGDAIGLRVLRGRGSELDRAFAFGVVRQLLERDVADAPRPPDRRRRARRGGVRRGGRRATRRGGPLRVAAGPPLARRQPRGARSAAPPRRRRPLGGHRLLRWLVFLAERVEEVGALLVAATRPAEPGADQELLDALMTAPAARVLRPAPLSAVATTTVGITGSS